MKLTIDEKLKHRLVGVAVIISICAIIAPAVMKKSSQRFDRNMTIAIKLPPKPQPPRIIIPSKSTLFEKLKVAQVDIPALPLEQPKLKIAKAAPLVDATMMQGKTEIAKIPTMKTEKEANIALLKKPLSIKKTTTSTATRNLNNYAVQLALFARQGNARILVDRLKSKGYAASYKKIVNKSSEVFYKVLVGSLNARKEAQALKQQLASSMQIKGFVVPERGVSQHG